MKHRSIKSTNRNQLCLIAILAFIACGVLTSNSPFASAIESDTVRFGIRDASKPVTSYCQSALAAFKDDLEKEAPSLSVEKRDIALNAAAGKYFRRFQGLYNNDVDIECGPNSISIRDLEHIDPATNESRRYGDWLLFSNRFHTTSIKLLMREDTAEDLEALSEEDRKVELANLRIAVAEGTTTSVQFLEEGETYRELKVYTAEQPDSESQEIGQSSWEQMLDDLDSGEIDAIASDGIVLQALLQEGRSGKGVKGTINHRKSRPPYKTKEFTVFPEIGLLPGISSEDYGIAIRREDRPVLLSSLNKAINELNQEADVPGSPKNNLERFENGEESLPSPAPSPNPPNPDPVPWGLITLVVILLFILAVGILRSWEKISATIDALGLNFSFTGSNDTSQPSSHLKIREVDARGDIRVSESNSHKSKRTEVSDIKAGDNFEFVTSNSSVTEDSSSDSRPSSSINEMTGFSAGRDINVFLKSIGFEDNDEIRISRTTVDRYRKLWNSLKSLSLAGRDFWDSVDEDSTLHFVETWKEVRRAVHGSHALDDFNRGDLYDSLDELGNVQIGHKLVRKLRSQRDVTDALTSRVISPNNDGRNSVLENVERQEDALFAYERAVETVRVYIRSRISRTNVK